MPSIKDITEPVKVYQQAKDMYHQNVLDFYDDLIKKSNTNLEANKSTCDEYYKKLTEIEAARKASSKKGKLRTFLKVLMIICFVLVVLIPVGLLIRSKIKNKIDKEIQNANEEAEKLITKANELKEQAAQQTALFNSMLEWNIPADMFSKTIPLIKVDQYFNNERLYYLKDKYGYTEHDGDDISTVFVQSGSILGNPFVIEQNYVQEMTSHVYTGTLVIHWTTYHRDSNGHSYPVHHTQTLVAHVSKPKPAYYLDTWLVYGNGAAPKLTFSRSPSDKGKMDDKHLSKFTKKFEKQLNKKSEKDMNFTKLANTKFEGLFNALNRDNEVEFRLLFTPLAQNNMVDLIRMNEPYGDDFTFHKQKQLNFIKTAHAQGFDYSADPTKFIDFDASKAKEALISYCDAYFQSLYFDLAPLLSIPLYQNYKATEYIYKDNHQGRYTSFETESIINHFDKSDLVHKDTATDAILKTEFVRRDGDNDIMSVTAHTFKAIPRVEMVPTLGGDGMTHLVPVPWDEYIKVSKKTPFIVRDLKKNRYEYSQTQNIFANHNVKNVYYQKGLVSALLKETSLDK
ncbi:MAG: hypothetical protein MJ213_00225 [Bacilli bacterium]|nr:hypothetical protein [Bacilli bacterium]